MFASMERRVRLRLYIKLCEPGLWSLVGEYGSYLEARERGDELLRTVTRNPEHGNAVVSINKVTEEPGVVLGWNTKDGQS